MSTVKSTLQLNSTVQVPSILNFSRSSSATRVNSIGLVETVAANAIRQDYMPDDVGRLMGWLFEEASTNSCLQSTAFDNASWITSSSSQTNKGTIHADQIKSPDGTQTGDILKASGAGTGIIAARQQGFTFNSGTTYTVSVYAKKKELDYLEISNKDEGGPSRTYSKVFNLSNGTLGSSGGTVGDAKILEHPNGWYRCSVTFTADGSSDTEVYLKARNNDENNTEYTHGDAEGIYLWGAQVEEVAYPTSYIPTTTVSVTRNADIAYVEDTENRWNWDVGTSIWVDATPLNTTATQPIYHYQDGDNNNYVTLLSNGQFKVTTNGNSQLDSDPFNAGFATTTREDFRNCMAIKANRFHAAHNGSLSEQLPDTTLMVPLNSASSKYTIKFFHGTGLTSGSGHLGSFRIYSNVLTDIELQNITFRKNDDAQNLALNAVQVIDQSISTQKLSNEAVTATKLATDAVTSVKILDGTIEAPQLKNSTITGDKIAPATIDGTKIANNAITSAHLGLDIIVAEDIANNAITVAEIANNAVTTDKIIDNAVTGAKIALGSDATGDVMYYSGTDYVRLAKGTDGQVLTLSGGLPSWANDSTDVGGTAVGGDMAGTVANIQIAANAVGSAEIADNAVTSSEINQNSVGITELNVSDGSVGQLLSTDGAGNLSFISDPTNVGNAAVGGDLTGSVANAQIAADAVGSAEIADDAVTSAHLADGAVSISSITDATITGAKLVDGTITGAKIANHASNDTLRSIDSNHIKNDAIDGTKLADNAIGSEHIANGVVIARCLNDLAVEEGKIAANAVTSTKIAATAVGNTQLANNAVSANKIDSNAVTTDKILDANVTTAKIADGAITNDKIGAGAITSDKIALDIIVAEDLANNSVTAAEISNNAVTTDKIQNNAVDGSKIAMGSDARGDILYYNGTDYVRLAKGTNGHVLTMGADDPTWSADSTNVSGTSVGGDLSGTVNNAQIKANTVGVSELNVSDGTNGQALMTNGAGVLSFGNVVSDPALGGALSGTTSNASIAANAVNGTHIAMGSDARGDVLYYDGTNYVRLGKGSAGQVLTQGANDPAWSNPAVSQNDVGSYPVGGDVSGTVSNITIPANSITSAMIAPGVIVAQDIATNAVNGTHIAMGSDAAGDTLYYNGTDYVRLPKGTAGQVLTMNGTASAPEWAADATNVGNTAVGGDVTGTVSNITIPNNAITSAMLGVDVIVAEDIANNAITVAELSDNAVATAKIQDLAITSAKIADDAVEMTKLNASGTASNTTFLRGDGVWATPAGITSESDPTAVTMAIALG